MAQKSIYGENAKRISRSALTTFEALFMQNAKQIIVEKVTKTASKHQFRGGFWSEWGDSNSRHLAPKASALPTALHPDIQFFCMIPCREGKSKFFVSVGGAVVKPDFAEVFQPGNFRRKLLSQGLPGFRFWGNG